MNYGSPPPVARDATPPRPGWGCPSATLAGGASRSHPSSGRFHAALSALRSRITPRITPRISKPLCLLMCSSQCNGEVAPESLPVEHSAPPSTPILAADFFCATNPFRTSSNWSASTTVISRFDGVSGVCLSRSVPLLAGLAVSSRAIRSVRSVILSASVLILSASRSSSRSRSWQSTISLCDCRLEFI